MVGLRTWTRLNARYVATKRTMKLIANAYAGRRSCAMVHYSCTHCFMVGDLVVCELRSYYRQFLQIGTPLRRATKEDASEPRYFIWIELYRKKTGK